MRSAPSLFAALATTAAILLASKLSMGGGTKLWELAGDSELEKGEVVNTAVTSSGEVIVGKQATQMDLAAEGLVWSSTADDSGTIYIGTGYDGTIRRVEKTKTTALATTGQMVVTAMVFDGAGDLYASTLPDPVIWKIEKKDLGRAGKEPIKAAKWATLPNDVKYIWALAADPKGNALYAGTGPSGKVFAIGRDGKASVRLETGEEHVLSLVAKKDKLLVGTSPGALLIESGGPGVSRALVDFDGTEVKAIALDGEHLMVAVNQFVSTPSVPTTPSLSELAKTLAAAAKGASGPRTGDGEIYRVGPSGERDRVWHKKGAHISSLVVDNGTTYAGLADDGQVISIDRDLRTGVVLDLKERQVMTLQAKDGLSFAGTGDAGAAYRISDSRPAQALYRSPPLDAEFTSRWGKLSWFAVGNLTARVRCGNTEVPDKTWTAWSKQVKNSSNLPCEPARFVQVELAWSKDPEAVLHSVELAFTPFNQRAIITELNPDSPFFSAGGSKKSSDSVAPSKRVAPAKPKKSQGAELSLSWKVRNPDDDELRYRLWYRAVGTKLWRPITKDDEVLTATRYKWNTETVPEGRYQIKLVADDSPANSPKETLSHELISVPVLVDNHQPRITGLSYAGGVLSGGAVDSFSSISALEYSVDGGPWMPFFAMDGVFDEKTEEFDLPLGDVLQKGPHAIGVRAYDRSGNVGLGEIHVEIP